MTALCAIKTAKKHGLAMESYHRPVLTCLHTADLVCCLCRAVQLTEHCIVCGSHMPSVSTDMSSLSCMIDQTVCTEKKVQLLIGTLSHVTSLLILISSHVCASSKSPHGSAAAQPKVHNTRTVLLTINYITPHDPQRGALKPMGTQKSAHVGLGHTPHLPARSPRCAR